MITLGITHVTRSQKEANEISITSAVRELVDAAMPLVIAVDVTATSGEWKRHQVYAQMIDKFPARSKNDLAFAIEVAVRQMKGRL